MPVGCPWDPATALSVTLGNRGLHRKTYETPLSYTASRNERKAIDPDPIQKDKARSLPVRIKDIVAIVSTINTKDSIMLILSPSVFYQ